MRRLATPPPRIQSPYVLPEIMGIRALQFSALVDPDGYLDHELKMEPGKVKMRLRQEAPRGGIAVCAPPAPLLEVKLAVNGRSVP